MEEEVEVEDTEVELQVVVEEEVVKEEEEEVVVLLVVEMEVQGGG